jgi:fructoselysine-6-P-deglycase FrlB-like protein
VAFFLLFVKPYQTVLKKRLLTESHQRARTVLLLKAEARENKLLSAPSIRHTIIFQEITVFATVYSREAVLPNELQNGSGSSREAKKPEEPEPKPLEALPKGA